VAYFLVIKRMECAATSKHPMSHVWRMRHRLAILGLFLYRLVFRKTLEIEDCPMLGQAGKWWLCILLNFLNEFL